jgi:cobalt-zinc-cadmium efflux system outer membrane protein
VRVTYATAATALAQAVFLRDQLLPEARRAYDIALTSYGLGGSSALDVLDARRTLLDAEGQYADALGAANDARADLERAVAGPFDAASAGAPNVH